MKELLSKIEKIDIFNEFIEKIIKQKSHAFLLINQSSETLKLFAKFLLLKMNCLGDKKPCFMCANCLKILNNTSVDVSYYPTKNSISVEDVLSMIDEVNVKPLDLQKRFFVFNNINNSSFQAQNKLLKTLEEPPSNVIFILTATSEENVLLTIKSRVCKMHIPALTQNDLKFFKDIFEIEDDLNLAFKLSNGNIGELNNNDNFKKMKEIYKNSLDILKNLKKSSDVNILTQQIVKQKGNSLLYLKCFQIIFRDVMIDLSFKKDKSSIEPDLNLNGCLNIIKKIEKANEKLQTYSIENGVIDELLLGILEERYLCKQK